MRKKVKSQIHSKDAYLALDPFWKTVEPFRSELETEYFRKLVMGLLFIKLSYEIFEHQNEMISQSTSSNRKKSTKDVHGKSGSIRYSRIYMVATCGALANN